MGLALKPFFIFTIFIISTFISVSSYGEKVTIIDKVGFSLKGIDLDSESPIYSEINNYMEQHYEDMARRQLERIDWDDNRHIWGGLNHIGLSYSKDFASFSLELKRQVAPDLFDDERWIVTDTFDILIDASVIFKQLVDVGAIAMNPADIASVAGLTFKRSYRFIHFADNYEKAISFNLRRLFFTFLSFRSNNFLKLKPGEFIAKEDFLGMHAGAMIALPLGSSLAAHVGALAKYSRIGKVEIHSPFPSERSSDEDYLRFNYERSKSVSLGVSAGLVGDFLGILKLTLFKYDLSYKLKESYKNYLSFSRQDIYQSLEHNSTLRNEIRKILKHQTPKLRVLAPYIVSEERRKSETVNSNYSLLYFSNFRDQQTTHIQVTKNNRVKNFFRHDVTYKKERRSLFDWLLNGFFKSFSQVKSYVKAVSEETKSLKVEYDHEYNLLKTKGDISLVESNERLSVHFVRDYQTTLKRNSSKRKVQSAIKMVDLFGGANPFIIDKYQASGLKGLIKSHVTTTFNEDGIKYLNNMSYGKLKSVIKDLCGSRSIFNICGWRLRRSVRSYIKERNSHKVKYVHLNRCNKKLSKLKNKFPNLSRRRVRSYHYRCLKNEVKKSKKEAVSFVPLWKLKYFLQKVLLYSTSKVGYYRLFGPKNVHIHGSIEGRSKKTGKELVNYFREGYFQGLGVISNYRRGVSSR